MRVAIGAYRGSTIKRVILALMVLGPAVGGLGMLTDILSFEVSLSAMMLPWPLTFAYIFTPPFASKAAIAAEQHWATSRPFELRGYLEVLSDEPAPMARLAFEIAWRPGARPPEPGLVQTACLAVDPAARVYDVTPYGLRIACGQISGITNIRINRVPVFRNHRIPAVIHAYVDTVLTTLHASYSIASVSIVRQATQRTSSMLGA